MTDFHETGGSLWLFCSLSRIQNIVLDLTRAGEASALHLTAALDIGRLHHDYLASTDRTDPLQSDRHAPLSAMELVRASKSAECTGIDPEMAST